MKRFTVVLEDQKKEDIRKKIFDETGERTGEIVIIASFINTRVSRVLFGKGITEGKKCDVFFCFTEIFGAKERFGDDRYEIFTSEWYDEVKVHFMKEMIDRV